MILAYPALQPFCCTLLLHAAMILSTLAASGAWINLRLDNPKLLCQHFPARFTVTQPVTVNLGHIEVLLLQNVQILFGQIALCCQSTVSRASYNATFSFTAAL